MTTGTGSNAARRHGPASSINTTQDERLLSSLAGLAFLVVGLARRGWLGVGLSTVGAGLVYRGAAGFSLIYRLLGENRAVVSKTAASSVPHGAGVRVERSITINRPVEEVYRFWRDFSNLPTFMEHVESIEVRDERHSHWIVKGPAGSHVEWDAEIVNEEANEAIAWRSLNSADVDNAGTVHFRPAPGNRGTELHVELEYAPVAGKAGEIAAKLFHSEPSQQVASDLYHLKQILEVGEIATVDGQPSGRR